MRIPSLPEIERSLSIRVTAIIELLEATFFELNIFIRILSFYLITLSAPLPPLSSPLLVLFGLLRGVSRLTTKYCSHFTFINGK